MSSKQKKGTPERKGLRSSMIEVKTRPAGDAPGAMVTARHGQGEVTRPGRGFSLGELTGASLSTRVASDWGVRLDARRRSTIQSNVESLKGWASHAGTTKKEGRVKELEEEVEKVEKVVKKGAVKAEKEVAKAEKEVKKEVSKAEKAVKRKAPRPKTKLKKKTGP